MRIKANKGKMKLRETVSCLSDKKHHIYVYISDIYVYIRFLFQLLNNSDKVHGFLMLIVWWIDSEKLHQQIYNIMSANDDCHKKVWDRVRGKRNSLGEYYFTEDWKRNLSDGGGIWAVTWIMWWREPPGAWIFKCKDSDVEDYLGHSRNF